ncbi:DUF6596 domain-containing protein [Agaribacter flavus]|uniref:DUF6596 domain-containing protein n=1 Tax=Agaribacter flavus TaxID=1902781 RepID=A0ABV7FMW6_9ALTE
MADGIRLPLVLKALGGMSVEAIARALLSKPETIKKRLTRSKKHLSSVKYEIPDDSELKSAIHRVHQCLYLMFNEGISTHYRDHENRRDICLSALRFLRLMLSENSNELSALRHTNNSVYSDSDTYALLALMHFHLARLDSRFDSSGQAIELNLQNRKLWDSNEIKIGAYAMASAMRLANGKPSVYLLEALIAFEHCRAKCFSKTDWPIIEQHYAALCSLSHSPLMQIAYAISLAHNRKFDKAVNILQGLSNGCGGELSQRVLASFAYVNALSGQVETAYSQAKQAKKQGLTDKEYACLIRQIEVSINVQSPV